LISAYLPYLGAIAWSNKKVGRYLLDAYPVLLFFAAVGMVWIAGTLVRGLLRAHVHKRTAVVLVAVLAISLGSARTLRLTAFMPHLAAWCADYPGLPCDRLIAFRPFIGLRDTAQWIASQEPNRRPKVYVTYFWRTRDPMPWLDYAIMRRPQDAEYVVVINSVLRRGYRNGFVSALEKGAKPVYRFRLGDREFVRVYRTPFGLRPES
jgi:hypothetical protein